MSFLAFDETVLDEPEFYGTAGELLGWMTEREQHNGLSVRQIVDVSGIYEISFLDLAEELPVTLGDKKRYNNCYADLRMLCKKGKVVKQIGKRPFTWAAWPYA